MINVTAIMDVTEKIKKYKQNSEKWINLKEFYDETRREIESRVVQHHYFSVDADEALKILDDFYSNQLRIELSAALPYAGQPWFPHRLPANAWTPG